MIKILLILFVCTLSLKSFPGAADGVGTDGPDTLTEKELMLLLPNLTKDFVQLLMREAKLKSPMGDLFKPIGLYKRAYKIDEQTVLVEPKNLIEVCYKHSSYGNHSEHLLGDLKRAELTSFIPYYLNLKKDSECKKLYDLVFKNNSTNISNLIIDSFLVLRAGYAFSTDKKISLVSAVEIGLLSNSAQMGPNSEVLIEYRKKGYCPSRSGEAIGSIRLQENISKSGSESYKSNTVVLCYALEFLQKLPKVNLEKILMSQLAHELTHLHYSFDEYIAENVERELQKRYEELRDAEQYWQLGYFQANCISILGHYSPKFKYPYTDYFSNLPVHYQDKRNCERDILVQKDSQVCLEYRPRKTFFPETEFNNQSPLFYGLYNLKQMELLESFSSRDECHEKLIQENKK